MKETKNVPQLRFSGFDDEWENKEFSELFERRMERNNGQFGYDRWISVAKMYFQKPDKVTSNNIDTRTYVMRKSDIAFEGHSNKDYKLGRFVENDIGDGVISELFPIYKHIASYDLNYWKYAIQIERIMFPKLTKCIEISYTSSNKLDEYFFLKEHVLVPSCSEQKKIGTFISHVDSLIQAKTKKLESLKAVKKSLLQKCFPKADEKVPEMRFAGFSGDWEEKEFIELVSRESKTKISDENNPCVEYEDVTPEIGILNNDIYKKKVMKTGIFFDNKNILYGKLRPYLHNWLKPSFEGVAVGDWWVLEPNNVDRDFLYRLIQTKKFDDIANQSSGSKMPRADWNLISHSTFSVPMNIEEQQKIGQFFSKYDSFISLQQKEIDNLKTIKKALLQKMFV